MAGRSRPKDGVASARLCPAIHVFVSQERKQEVDARDKPGHDLTLNPPQLLPLFRIMLYCRGCTAWCFPASGSRQPVNRTNF